jgi:hypothetical protein
MCFVLKDKTNTGRLHRLKKKLKREEESIVAET